MRCIFFILSFLLAVSLFSMDSYLTDSAHSSADEFRSSEFYSEYSDEISLKRKESVAEFIETCELRACEEGFAQKAELYKYAIKELIEQQHRETKRAKKHKKQKWLAMAVGALTTLGPALVTIYQSMQPSKEPDCITITTSP